MSDGVLFDEKSARRIARAVRAAEGSPRLSRNYRRTPRYRAGGSLPFTGVIFVVEVSVSGGADGDENGPATWVYDIFTHGADLGQASPIGTDLSPVNDGIRGAFGPVVPGSRGLAFRDIPNDNWVLWEVDEKPGGELCELN
jgi:hypothetical protein